MINKSNAVILTIVLAASLIFSGCGSSNDAENVNEIHNENTSLSNESADPVLNYLAENILNPNFGGRVFSAYKVLASDSGKLFIWAVIHEYYMDETGGTLKEGTGMSVPVVLDVNSSGNGLTVMKHTLPRDGAFYTKDIKKLFPPSAQSKIFSIHETETVEELQSQVKKRAEQWYQKNSSKTS